MVSFPTNPSWTGSAARPKFKIFAKILAKISPQKQKKLQPTISNSSTLCQIRNRGVKLNIDEKAETLTLKTDKNDGKTPFFPPAFETFQE
jgi:hypothetical protein